MDKDIILNIAFSHQPYIGKWETASFFLTTSFLLYGIPSYVFPIIYPVSIIYPIKINVVFSNLFLYQQCYNDYPYANCRRYALLYQENKFLEGEFVSHLYALFFLIASCPPQRLCFLLLFTFQFLFKQKQPQGSSLRLS
jgi:hypothetical protein